MNLRDLLHMLVQTGQSNRLCECIHHCYYKDTHPDEIRTITLAYERVIQELLNIESTGTVFQGDDLKDYMIHTRSMIDDTEEDPVEYTDVCLKHKETQDIASIDFVCWEVLVNLKIDTEVGLSNKDLACHILWELTFYGFTNKQVQLQGEDLLREARTIKGTDFAYDNLITYEEFKKQLTDDK